MDLAANPYSPGSGLRPKVLSGRAAEVEPPVVAQAEVGRAGYAAVNGLVREAAQGVECVAVVERDGLVGVEDFRHGDTPLSRGRR